jgi:hypothetical protein
MEGERLMKKDGWMEIDRYREMNREKCMERGRWRQTDEVRVKERN